MLYDKICREDILRHAYGLARAKPAASGVDGVSFAQIEASGLEAWLAGLREELVSYGRLGYRTGRVGRWSGRVSQPRPTM